MADTAFITAGPGAHSALIADLLKFPEVKTTGFFAALRSLPEAPYFTGLLRDDKTWTKAVRLVPDAYAIDPETWTVTIFEVVASNDISPEKMGRIVELGWGLDGDGWTLALIRCDLAGRRLYDPIGLYVVEASDRINAPADEALAPMHHRWQRYTVDYCSARFVESHSIGGRG